MNGKQSHGIICINAELKCQVDEECGVISMGALKALNTQIIEWDVYEFIFIRLFIGIVIIVILGYIVGVFPLCNEFSVYMLNERSGAYQTRITILMPLYRFLHKNKRNNFTQCFVQITVPIPVAPFE